MSDKKVLQFDPDQRNQNLDDRIAAADDQVAWTDIANELSDDLAYERERATIICACGDRTTNADGVCWICRSLDD